MHFYYSSHKWQVAHLEDGHVVAADAVWEQRTHPGIGPRHLQSTVSCDQHQHQCLGAGHALQQIQPPDLCPDFVTAVCLLHITITWQH